MGTRLVLVLIVTLACGIVSAAPAFFSRDIRQILPNNCDACRGFDQRITKAYEFVLSRKPSFQEVEILSQLHSVQRARFSQGPEAAKALLEVGLAQAPETAPDLAAGTSVSPAILNLHETITRY